MNVMNCKKCGKLFNYIAGPHICPSCKDALEQKFVEVKKYIQEHHHCSMTEVCEECDVDARQIQTWIKQERLQFAEDSGIKVSCENCGAQILSGRFCEKCKNEMSRNLSGAIHRPEAQPAPEPSHGPKDNKNRMRFL